jgi:hypothetical protein
MQRNLIVVLAIVAGFFGLTDSVAHASYTPWDYHWSASSPVVESDGPGISQIRFSGQEGDASSPLPQQVLAATLQAVSSVPRTNPDSFSNRPYRLALTIRDGATDAEQTLTFGGLLNGALSRDSSLFWNRFIGPATQTVVVAGHRYIVSVGPFATPGPPGSADPGRLEVRITPWLDGPQPRPIHFAEPSGLVLAGLGLCGLGTLGLRRFRGSSR